MMGNWQHSNDKFAALSSREKWLILICSVVLIFMVIFTLLLEPAMEKKHALTKRLNTIQSNITQLKNENMIMEAKLQRDPNEDIKKQFDRLTRQNDKLDKDLDEAIGGLIAPSQMPELLEEVLTNSKNLKLVSLTSMPAESLTVQGASDQQDESQAPSIGYYLHPVKIELTGKYFDILEYLQALEAMPKQYYWRSYQYKVEEYPQARLIMQVYTLGSSREFIGG